MDRSNCILDGVENSSAPIVLLCVFVCVYIYIYIYIYICVCVYVCVCVCVCVSMYNICRLSSTPCWLHLRSCYLGHRRSICKHLRLNNLQRKWKACLALEQFILLFPFGCLELPSTQLICFVSRRAEQNFQFSTVKLGVSTQLFTILSKWRICLSIFFF